MKTKQLKIQWTTALILLVSTLLFTACGKKDSSPSLSGKSAKITFSVSGTFDKASGDDFSIGAGGGKLDGTYVDWKVNGATEIGTVVTVGSDFVDGGISNAVIESVQKFSAGSVTISSFNIGGDPFTVTYKVEVDGKIIDEKSVTIADGDDPLYKNYTL